MQATRGAAGRFSLRARSGSPTRQRSRQPRSRRGGDRIAAARRHRPGDRRTTGPSRPGQGVHDAGRPGRPPTRCRSSMGDPRFVSGGSVANTTAGIAVLGGTAGFVGAVADDEVGRTYTENLRAAGVEFEPHLSESAAGDGLGTGRCVVLITEDADRTMGTYLGAASTLTPGGCPDVLRRPRLHRPARGVSVGRAGRQGSDAARRRHRPCRRRLGRPVAVRPVLRGAPPARVPRPPARRRRHPPRQRGRDHHALRGPVVQGRAGRGRGDRAAGRHDPGRAGRHRAHRPGRRGGAGRSR